MILTARSSLLSLSLASLLLASPALAAPNPELAKAEQLFDALKYSEAITALKNAYGTPNNDRSTILRIYELLGIIDATMGKPTALDHFRKLVSLDPDHILSRDLGPRILAPFYEAKARLDEDPPLSMKTSSSWADGELELRVEVKLDRLRLASRLAIFWKQPDGTWASKTVPLKPVYEQSVPGDAVDWYVRLLGAYGGVVMEAGTEVAPMKAPSVVPVAVKGEPPAIFVAGPPEVARPMSTRRKIAIGAAGGGALLLITSGVLGGMSASLRSQFDNPQRDESGRLIGITPEIARSLEIRTRNTAIGANTALGVGVGLVATGVLLWIFDSRPPPVALVPSFNGAALVGTLP